jgi:FkbH-like protein
MKETKYLDLLGEHRLLDENRDGLSFLVRVLSNVTVNQLKELLELCLLRDRINATVSIGNYDNLLQDSIQADYADLVIVFWDLCRVYDHLATEIESWSQAETEALFDHLSRSIDFFLDNLKGHRTVFFNRFSGRLFSSHASAETRLEGLAKRLNLHLEAVLPPNVVLIDLDRIYSLIGIKNSVNWRDYYFAAAPYSIEFLKAYVDQLTPSLRSITGKTKKALILDCDNTLWSGILGEDGADGIAMSRSSLPGGFFFEVQQMICGLKNQGVILGLCSKNNADEVEAVFNSHKDMKLKMSDISIQRINWSDKVTNLEEISEELNIGLDSLVFVDDSEFEIQAVSARLPSVTVYKVPDKLEEYPRLMREITINFDQPSFTDEDNRRAEMYKDQAVREKAKAKFASMQDYLRSLNLNVQIECNAKRLVGRVAQMSQRTTQFNLTNIRYTESEIEDLMRSQEYDIFSLSATDRFGDYGVTALCIIKRDPNDQTADIVSFLMSCRIIGRNIEYAFLNYVMEWLHREKIMTVRGRYVASDRNKQVANFFDSLAFPVTRDDDNVKSYEISLDKYQLTSIEYIGVAGDN